ncbi:tyrosine-type recombinase/integrase [Marvinbryantia sp.]|uniref:tyrosine-type recombinase/integrase n=1 Tax=Marvinbryantia sp. TaxID=2496532 RepID=UPI0025ED314C|nr:tyrosine-type recombinase/integrase [uncultured Marvinbryantia sp.]
MAHLLEKTMLQEFQNQLKGEEKAQATIEKYMRDVSAFFAYVKEENEIDKSTVIAYKEYLTEHYAAASVNSMLAAVNAFLKMMGWHECTVKALKIQKEAFRARERDLTKAEYFRLLDAAGKKKNQRLYWMMQVLCATGIRVSELRYITVEALQTGCATVSSKGKQRNVLLSAPLCRKLRKYVAGQKITGGSIFVTRSGKPVDRSNICHEMKALCGEAGICREKVFPHNLRHLFAVTYYKMKKDISHLADLLGHASINTTRIYTLVSSEEQKRQIEYLGLVV